MNDGVEQTNEVVAFEVLSESDTVPECKDEDGEDGECQPSAKERKKDVVEYLQGGFPDTMDNIGVALTSYRTAGIASSDTYVPNKPQTMKLQDKLVALYNDVAVCEEEAEYDEELSDYSCGTDSHSGGQVNDAGGVLSDGEPHCTTIPQGEDTPRLLSPSQMSRRNPDQVTIRQRVQLGPSSLSKNLQTCQMFQNNKTASVSTTTRRADEAGSSF